MSDPIWLRNGVLKNRGLRDHAQAQSMLVALVTTVLSVQAFAQAPAQRRTYICPIDGGQAMAHGDDGRQSPKRFSDFEVPTRAYTNLVVACPKCGYANWTQDFERPVSGIIVNYVHGRLKSRAKLAAVNPVVAYEHHMNLLHQRRAPIQEQIGAALFYSYVLKRGRPAGGIDPALERKIVASRKRVLKMLQRAMKTDPPHTTRGKLEWRYLIGELKRLTGDAKGGQPELQAVCDQREVGYTVRKLACEMADRARRDDTSEDYREGEFDVRGIEAAEKQASSLRAAPKKAAEKKAAEKKAEKLKASASKKTGANASKKKEAKTSEKHKAPPPSKLSFPTTAPSDKYAPPPPPPAK